MREQRVTIGVLAVGCAALAAAACADDHSDPSAGSVSRARTQDGLNFVPDFPGAGLSGADAPLAGGTICDSVLRVNRPFMTPRTACFFEPGKAQPSATIEQVLECVEDVDSVHLRLTFDPAFVDNTYGANAIGWGDRGGPGKRRDKGAAAPGAGGPPPPAAAPPAMPGGPGMVPPPPRAAGMPIGPGAKGPDGKAAHSWKDLVGSDHAEFMATNGDGELVAQFKLDYVSEDEGAESGYASLGVEGGDGKMLTGEASDVVRWRTSIERNLNERGYPTYIVDSPETDLDYTPNVDTPNWDYRVVYEVWLDIGAFGASGFGGARIEHVHASPAKTPKHTITVEPGECPCVRDGGCGDGPPPPDRETFCEDNPEDPDCQLL